MFNVALVSRKTLASLGTGGLAWNSSGKKKHMLLSHISWPSSVALLILVNLVLTGLVMAISWPVKEVTLRISTILDLTLLIVSANIAK